MDKDSQIIKAAQALGIGNLIPEVYRDMLQPAARKVGESLATIAEAVKISLAPLEAGIWGYEQIKQWLLLRVTRILVDRETKTIEAPPLSIAGPLVYQLIFARDEPDLCELYASLLASAMNPHEHKAHPSFVSIIHQLTPDEARILKHLAQSDEKWPSLSAHESIGRHGGLSVRQQFKSWCDQSAVAYPERSDVYLDNLVRLRILHQIYGNEAKYAPPGSNRYGDYEASVHNEEYEFVELTAFGRSFLDACVEKKDPKQPPHPTDKAGD